MTSFKEEVTLLEKCIATCLPGKEADVRVKLCRKTVEIGCHSDILRKSDVLSNWLGKRKEATNVSMDVGHLDTATFLRVLFFLYTGKVRAGLGAVEKMYHDLVCMYLKIPLDAEGFLAVVEWEEDRWCDLALEVTPEREGMVPVISQLMCTFKHAHCLPRNKGTVSLPTLKNGKPGMVLTQSAFKDHIIQTVHPIRGVSFNRLNHFCVNHNGLTLVGYEMHTIVIQLPPLERGVASNICGFIQAIWPGVHLIICNPRGLTVDDVSLHKNTARLTLTTGEVTVKSGQIKFYVTEGTLTICGRGVELRNLDRLSIFCHKLVVASTLSTKNLNIVTGPNIVEVDSFDEGAHDDNMAQITEIPTASPTLSFEVWKTAAISVFHGTIGVTGEGANNGRISSNTLDLDVSGILENSKTATICANLEAKLVAKHCENGGRIECDGKLRGIFDTYRTTQGSTVDCKDTKFVCRNYEVDGDFCGSLDIEAVLFENHSSMTCEGVKVRAEQVRNKGRIKSEDFDVVSTKMENEKDGLISSTNFNIRLNGEESKFENAGKIVSKVVTLNTEKFENITSGRMECGQIQLTTMHMGNNGSIKSEDFDLNSVTAVNGGDGLLISSKHLTVQLSGLESSFQNFGKVVAKKVSASTNKFVNSTNATFYSEGDCSVNFGDVGNATFENMGTVELHGICDLTTKEFSNKNKFYGNDVKIKGEKWHNGNRAIFHSSQFARAAVSSTFENFGKCTSANVFKVEANHVTNSGLIGGKEVDLAGSSGIKNGGVFQAEDEIKLASKVYEDTANSEISASRVSINCGETTVMGSVSGEIMRVAGETCKLERGSRIRVENGDYDVSKELVFNSPPEQNTLKIRGSGKIRNLAGISAQSGDIENTAEFRNIAPLLIEDLSLVTDVFENLGGAIVEGGKTSVSAKKFNNQGMINGTSTCTITSEVVSNAGKSIIHGGVLHIRSKVVENPRHGVIAARDGIKAEIDEFFNREDAVFYSGGFLDFGGYSNSHCQNFENISGIVDIKRDGNFSVRNFHQKNPAFRTELRFVSKFGMIDAQSGQRINISTSDKPYPELHKFSGGRRFFRFGRRVLVPESWVPFKDYTSYKFNRSISQTHIVETSPAKIYIGGRLTLSSETVLTNDKSHIFSQSMVGSLGELINLDEYGIKRIVDGGHSQSSWMETHRGGRKYRIAGPKKRKRVREYSSIAGYNPPAVDQPVQLQAYTCMLEDTPPEVGSQAGIQTLMGEYRTSNLVSYNVRRNAGIIRYQKISSEHYFDVGTLINHRFMFEIAGNNTFLRVDERLITPRQSEMEITISGMLGELGVSNPLRLPIILEQNIVRNQLIEMVGAILLTSFNDEDSQYVTLARNGFKFSAKFNILSGAELSSEHLERLEESIIWFVWRKIQTPNKDLKTALFPQVYLLERKSYQNPAGNSIISTNKMDLIIESVTNCGVLFANDMKLSAGSFLNDEGTVASGEKGMDILVQSQFTNLSGNLMGRGGKMRLETVDGDIVNETKVMPGGSNLGETATIYMQDGDLEMKSGRDFISKAAQFGNSGEGETRIGAKRDINLGAVGLHKSQRIVWDENSNMSEEYKDEVGSVLKMGGNLHLDAIDGDITTTGMRMEVGKKLGMDANNVNILSGEASSTFEIEHTSRHEFTFSSSTVHSKKTGSQKRAKPSQIAANDFVVTARDSLKTSGAVICVENELIGKAGNSISLLPAEESFKSYTYRDATTDDIFSESNTITDRGREGVRNRPTVLDSATGNVRMTAGGKFEQVGSLQQAAQGTVAAAGSTVNILPAVNSDRTTEHVSHTESGLFFGVSNPLLDGISNLEMLRELSSGDEMMPLLAATASLSLLNTMQAISSNWVTGGGLNVSVKFGTTEVNMGHEVVTVEHVGSQVIGKRVELISTEETNITGSLVRGEDTARVVSKGAIKIGASQDSCISRQWGDSRSSMIGLDVGLGVGQPVSAQVGFQYSESESGGDWEQKVTRPGLVQAGNCVEFSSGSDTTISGGIISARNVEGRVGGNLRVESIQDEDSLRQQFSQTEFGLSYDVRGGGVGINFQHSEQDTSSNYISVIEQHGISADQFDVDVAGHTHLKGGMIFCLNSENSSLATGTLSYEDVVNKFTYDMRSISVGASLEAGKNKKSGKMQLTPGASMPLVLHGADSAISRTESHVGGKIEIKKPELQKQSLTRLQESVRHLQPLGNVFDGEKLARRTQMVTAFASQVSTFLSNRVKSIDLKRQEVEVQEEIVKKEPNVEKKFAALQKLLILRESAEKDRAMWGPGGTGRQICTALSAAFCGNVGQIGSLAVIGREAGINFIQARAVSEIGRMVRDRGLIEGHPLHVAAHALLAFAGAAARRENPLGPVIVAGVSSIIPAMIMRAPDPLESEQETLSRRNLLVTTILAAAIFSGQSENVNLSSILNTATIALDNNFLSSRQFVQFRTELSMAGTIYEKTVIIKKWIKRGAHQLYHLEKGFAHGIIAAGIDEVKGMVDLISDIGGALTQIRKVLSDPEIRRRIGHEIVASLEEKLGKVVDLFENGGGNDDAFKLGKELGQLTFHAISLTSGVVGGAKLVVKLPTTFGKLGKKGIKQSWNVAKKGASTAKSSVLPYIKNLGEFMLNVDRCEMSILKKMELAKFIQKQSVWTKAQFGEFFGEQFLRSKLARPFSPLEMIAVRQTPGGKGIDAVYRIGRGKSAELLVVEYKFGTAGLNMTKDGRQMCDTWVRNRLQKALPNNPREAAKLLEELEAGSLKKLLVRVNEYADTTVHMLDGNARKVGVMFPK